MVINMAKEINQKYEQDVVGDGISSIQKVIEPHKNESNHIVKYVLIGACALFLFIMLILPLAVVVMNAFREGWAAYQEAVFDEYTIKALQLTLLATVCAVVVNTIFGVFAAWALSNYNFRGKRILLSSPHIWCRNFISEGASCCPH